MSHKELILSLLNIYNQKNLAYGNSAHATFCRYGSASYALRLSDKFQRYEKLISSPDIPHGDESIDDTLGDAITYMFMFAADLFCVRVLGEKDSNEDANIQKVRHMMVLTMCCSEDEIQSMAHTFWENHAEGVDSLVDVIYNMYSDSNVSYLDYIMFACYLIKLYIERKSQV